MLSVNLTNGVMKMKMSDVFTGELIHYESANRGFYGDIGQVTSETTGCKTFITIASYRDKYDYAVAICQAVNNHDRITSENARLREALESTVNGKQPHELGTKVPEHLTGLNYTWHFSINDGLFHGYDANGNYVEVTFKNVEPIDSDALMVLNLLTELEKGDE